MSENVRNGCLLEFQTQMFLDLLNEDCLVITAKGLGIEEILVQLFKAYNDSGNLVLVIGTTPEDEDYIINRLENEGITELPKRITSDYGSNDRSKVYLEGGILFVTSRILIVDMLLQRVPYNLITGIVVHNAHRILEASQDAFILRLYRSKNKIGFIKGFSQNPNGFTYGFGRLDRIMRYLFVKKLQLWPRFHALVTSSFESRSSPEVIEIRIDLTPIMKTIQFALMDLISMCLKELIKSNISQICDVDNLTPENAIGYQFDKFLRTQLEPYWHQLSNTNKRTIADLKLLRHVLYSLTNDDSVTFYNIIRSIRQSVKLDSNISDWIFWEPSETLFVSAEKRVFSIVNGTTIPDIEQNPKWTAFEEIIEEIKHETKDSISAVHVLVIVDDDHTSEILDEIMQRGSKSVLQELYEKTRAGKENVQKAHSNSKPVEKDPGTITLTQLVRRFDEAEQERTCPKEFRVHFHHLNEGYHKLSKYLYECLPKHIILYDPDVQCIRLLELYQAVKCSPERAKIYFEIYDGSAEEQRYLTSLRREKEAFTSLVQEKSTMVIPADRDGKCENHPDLIRLNEVTSEFSSRQAGGQGSLSRNQIIQQTIVVDMREFRSELPSLIHKRGIDIEPVTLETGDYVLSPDTCVERKSISDLIGSLNNGRLYSQCCVMTRHYKRAIVLIEFDAKKSFNFKGKYFGLKDKTISSNGIENYSMIDKLILLTIHFPQLRMIWSPSGQFTAELFEYLKADKEQPDAETAIKITQNQIPSDHYMDKYDHEAKEFLLNCPGVNLNNVYSIMNSVKCVSDLVKLSVEELNNIMCNLDNANVLHKALHSNLVKGSSVDIEAQQKSKGKKRFNSKKFKSSA